MRVKSEERRQAIIQIAKKLFTTQGVDRTSMSAIAKELGGSKGTLYNYFGSKEEIFAAVMESVADRGMSLAFDELSPEKDLDIALMDFGYNYLILILTPELAAIHKMVIAEAGRSPISHHFYEHGPRKGWSLVVDFFQSCIDAGTLGPCDTWVAALQLKALLEAELVEQYELDIIPQPSDTLISEVNARAIKSFLMIYKPLVKL